MSQLKTYARDGEDLFVLPDGIEPTEPGQLVAHTAFPASTVGTVVAIDETDVCVLWSKEPFIVNVGTFSSGGYAFAPYVPLQVTPTIFASGSFISPSLAPRYSKQAIRHNFFVTGSLV